MDALQREVTNYMVTSSESSAESLQAANRIVQAVNTSSVQANLLQLIQCMGEYLTNEDDLVRAKATGLLSHTLRHCNVQSLNEAVVSVLVDFYCDRLTDRACVPNLLEGLVALTEAPNFTGANAVTVSTRIFERVEVQRFPQATRNLAFRIFENLLQNQLSALKAINNEFVYGFTQAMDGEKDPRNLMCAFKLIKIITDEFDIATHVEDIFEVTFCYFPITFRPPPDDPYGITADDLKQSLRRCLSATPHFARFAVPLLLEKLSSTSGSAKKDSMETLAACAPVYGASVFLPLIDEVFDALKVEVFHSTDPALEDSALHAIEKVVATIGYYGTGPAGDPTEKVLKPLVVECIANLKEPEFKNAKPAGRILRAAASASYSAANSIVNAVLPLLLRQHRETEVATRKKAILDVLLEFLEANKALYGSADGDVEMEPSTPSPLLAYKDRLLPLFESSVMASNEYNGLRLSALKGLELMALSKNFLDDNELGLAVQSFNKILVNETDEELRSAALASLKALSNVNGKYVTNQTVPELTNLLPETSLEKGRIGYKQTLTAFKILSPFPTIFQAALPALLNKLDVICKNDEYSTYACAVLDTLLNVLEAKSNEKHSDVATCMDSLVPQLISSVVTASLNGSDKQIVLQDDVLIKIALIIMIVYENVKASTQKPFADSMFALFVDGDLSKVGISGDFAPLKQASSYQQKATTRLFSAIVCASRKEVEFPVASLDAFLDSLVETALMTDCKSQLESVVRMIGSLINKWRDGAATSAYVEKLSSSLQNLIDQSSDQASNALAIYLWVTKALVQKSSQQGMVLADKVIAWCANAKVGKEASEGFDILSGDDRLALNKAAFATVTILHKQRFFNSCLPKVVDGFRSSSEDIKHNYLIALSYLLKNVPKQILLSELPPLAPLLIQSLSLPDTALKVSTLDMFQLAIVEAAEAITPHVRSIIPAILDLLDAQKNPMQVRIAALKCLAQFPSGLSSNVLAPHANYVIRQLGRSLDDRKRLVRKEAVDCRAKWYTVNI